MSELIVSTRRGFLKGLGLIIAAPAIVRVSNLMRVVPVDMAALEAEIMADPLFCEPPPNALLTIDMITRAAIRMFKDSNAFIRSIDRDAALRESAYAVLERSRPKSMTRRCTLPIRIAHNITLFEPYQGPGAIDQKAALSARSNTDQSEREGVCEGLAVPLGRAPPRNEPFPS